MDSSAKERAKSSIFPGKQEYVSLHINGAGDEAEEICKENEQSFTFNETQSSKLRMTTIALVVAWYTSNIGVIILNKYLLSNYDYKYAKVLILYT